MAITQTITLIFVDGAMPAGGSTHVLVTEILGNSYTSGSTVVAVRLGTFWVIVEASGSAQTPIVLATCASVITAGNSGTFTRIVDAPLNCHRRLCGGVCGCPRRQSSDLVNASRVRVRGPGYKFCGAGFEPGGLFGRCFCIDHHFYGHAGFGIIQRCFRYRIKVGRAFCLVRREAFMNWCGDGITGGKLSIQPLNFIAVARRIRIARAGPRLRRLFTRAR